MAYETQEWVNDDDVKGKVTAEKMTHIEDGIYDNSLATDKINPSGTATTTAEIEEGQINDVIGFKSLKLKGQTSQYTTQGNNLLDIYARHPAGYTETVSGVTFTYNDDGSVNAKGTATADVNFFLASNGQLGDDIFNGTNYLSGCTGGSSTTFHLQFWADTIGHFQNTTTEVATNKTAGVNWNITIGIKNGVTIDKTFYPMMSATSGKTFEKYSGGKASPNPDYPQDVNNVSGYNAIEISNVNKLPYAQSGSYAVSGMTHTSNGKGVYTLNGTATANSRYDWAIEPYTIKQGDYLYLGNTATNSTVTVALLENASTQIMYTGPTQVNRIVSLNNYVGRKVTYIRTYTNAQTLTNFVLKPMICTTTSVSDFVEHQGNNFEINLGKNLIEDTFKGYNINSHGQFETGGTSADFDVQIARVMQGVTYTITPSTNVIAYFNGKPTKSSTSYNGSREVITNTNTLTPTKSGYIAIRTATSDTAQLEKGAIATPYAPYFPPIYIGKTGSYCNDIRKYNGKWYWHKEVGKVILDGVNYKASTKSGTTANIMYTTNNIPGIKPVANNGTLGNLMTSHFKNTTTDIIYSGDVIGIGQRTNEQISIGLGLSSTLTTLELFNAWLAENNVDVYYPLATPIDEEITYAPLLRQLDELYNSGLYDVTNISQDNSSEAFILDIEACKNNINGIVEYIRR